MPDDATAASAGWFAAVPRIIGLAVPMTASRFGLLLILVTDVALLGRIDTAALAAFAVAATPTQFLTAICNGLMSSVTVMVARDPAAAADSRAHLLASGCRVALLAGCLTGTILMLGPAFMPLIVGDPALAASGAPITPAFAWGMPGLCLFLAMSAYHEARGRVVPVLWAVGAGVVLNAAGIVLLLYHGGGATVELGWGVAMITSAARWAMCAILAALTFAVFPGLGFRKAGFVFRMLRIGAPLAFASMLESSAFTTIALIATRFGTDAVAAYEISSTVVRIAHLPALGLGAAATVLVARALGEGGLRRARDLVRASYAVVLALMVLVAMPLLFIPEMSGRWFSAEPRVLELLLTLFPITAAIVIADGVQAVLVGSLRGHGDVTVPAGLHILSFWLIAVPMGFWLAVRLNWSINGCAAALAAGLIAATCAFAIRLKCLKPQAASYA